MRMRTVALVVGWAVACLVTTSVGWVAVDLVGNEVAPAGPDALSQAEVERRIHVSSTPSVPGSASLPASTAGPTSAGASGGPTEAAGTGSGPGGAGASGGSTRSAGSSATGATPVARVTSRSFSAVGGTVVLTCTGTVPTLRSAPRAGFEVSETPEADAGKIKIVFSDGSHRSQVEVGCAGGVPTAQIGEGVASATDD